MSSSAQGPSNNAKFRQNRRLSEMSAQESLISKKKAEIQDRLRAKEKEEKPSSEEDPKTKEDKATPEEPKEKEEEVAASLLVNKFANDGSFMKEFMRLKNKRKAEENKEEEEENKAAKVLEEEEDEFPREFLPEEGRCLPHRSQCSPPVDSSSLEAAGEAIPLKGAFLVLPSAPTRSSNARLLSETTLSTVAEELASMVAVSGDRLEDIARMGNADEDQLSFLYNTEGEVYQTYRRKVDALRSGIIEEHRQVKEGQGKKRRTRWGDENDKIASLAHPEKSQELLAYAVRVFGSIDLEPHQWKQCEDQLKMNLVYEDILRKQEENKVLSACGRNRYEYDSDEDVEGGTWEHKARKLEMDKTMNDAEQLTESGAGRHHIGDFLPPEELSKFMAKYQALRDGRDVDESDYLDNKLTEDNKGFKLLQKMGWSEGVGLGSSGQGITAPISNNGQGSDKKGLGVNKPHELDKSDDEFDAYRKRMMMAYRFRPNPLNNPRRAYY